MKSEPVNKGIITIFYSFYIHSILGFSLNKSVVRNTYWATADLPRPEVGNDKLDLNIKQRYGLRLMVQMCDGSYCNDKGDDLVEPYQAFRYENCISDDDNAEKVCYDCRDAGLSAGSMVIIALFIIVASLGLDTARLGSDSYALKMWGIFIHFAVAIVAFIAVAVWGGQCYQGLQDHLLAGNSSNGDDYIDDSNIKFYIGPGMALMITTLLIQPVIVVALYLADSQIGSANSEGDQKAPVAEKEADQA